MRLPRRSLTKHKVGKSEKNQNRKRKRRRGRLRSSKKKKSSQKKKKNLMTASLPSPRLLNASAEFKQKTCKSTWTMSSRALRNSTKDLPMFRRERPTRIAIRIRARVRKKVVKKLLKTETSEKTSDY